MCQSIGDVKCLRRSKFVLFNVLCFELILKLKVFRLNYRSVPFRTVLDRQNMVSTQSHVQYMLCTTFRIVSLQNLFDTKFELSNGFKNGNRRSIPYEKITDIVQTCQLSYVCLFTCPSIPPHP